MDRSVGSAKIILGIAETGVCGAMKRQIAEEVYESQIKGEIPKILKIFIHMSVYLDKKKR